MPFFKQFNVHCYQNHTTGQNPMHSDWHFKQNWGWKMSPSHPGQLNTSHNSWHHSKGSLTLLTNHQSQSEKHPVTLANPYMGNTGQHPHKWQEIELRERMWFVWALEDICLLTAGEVKTGFIGFRIRTWCLKIEMSLYWRCMWLIWGNYSKILSSTQDYCCINYHFSTKHKKSYFKMFNLYLLLVY